MEWDQYAAFIQRLLAAPNEATARRILRASNLVTSTDDLAEGVTNLYFTVARARAAAVADALVDGVLDVAPSQNAVFDAFTALTAAYIAADAALLTGTISDGDTTHAPTGNAVFDALALKVDASGLSESIDDRVATLLVAGTNITLTYNDGAGTLTIDASGGGGSGISIGLALQLPNLPTFL